MTDAFDELFGQKTEEPENEFDMLFRQQSDTQKVRGTLDVVSQDSPDEMARAFNIADKRGLDPLAVKENLGEIERQEKVGGIDLEDLKKNNPALFKMLQDPRKAAVSHDSVDNLSMIERLVVKQWDIDRSFVAGSTDFLGRGTHGASETIQAYTLDPLIGITTRSLEGIAGAEKGTALGDLFGRIVRATSPIVHIGEAGQKVKDLSDFIRPPVERQNLATDIAEGIGQISSQLLVSVFAPEVGIPMLFGQGADIQDERLAEKGITDGNRRRAALAIGGGITAVTEKIALDKLLDRIPPKIKNKVLQKLADIGIASGIEAVQEVVEGIGHNLATFGLYDREQQIFVPEEAQREALAAGGAAGFVRAFLQGVLPGRMRIDAAEDHAEHLRNLGEEVRKSPVFARRKQVVSELIREASGGQQVYLPVAETVQLFQSKVPGFDLAENFEWAQDEIDAALETGTDLPVDLGKFAEQADSPAYDGMVELVRRTPEEPNFVETANRQFQAALDDEYRKAVQASENEAQEARASLTIGNTVSRYLTDVGLSSTVSRDIGTAYQAFFETLETKGANADEIFQKLGLRVERELPASIARSTDEIDVLLNELRSGKLPSQVEAFGPSLIDFLREQGVSDDRGDLQALDIDKGLRPGQRKLLREDGRSLDDLALSAYEAGYFPRFAGRPDVNQLLEAVDRETRGEATFSADLGNTRVRARREALDDLQNELDRRGLSTDQTNEELRAALLSEQSDGDGVTYRQGRIVRNEAFNKWFGDSKVVDENGDPLVVYHGTGQTFTRFDIEGQGKTRGTGAWFSSSGAVASTYALGADEQVLPVYLSLQNPMIVEGAGVNWNRLGKETIIKKFPREVSNQEDVDLLEQLTGDRLEVRVKTTDFEETTLGEEFPGELLFDDDFASVDDLARYANQQGYDGIIFNDVIDRGPRSVLNAPDEINKPHMVAVAFRGEQVKSVFNDGDFSPYTSNILNQSANEQGTLVVQHNISAKKLLSADKQGGLAVPSVAVARGDAPLNNFGEITLIGDKGLIDPRASKTNKVFGSDIYSPRYPSIVYDVAYKNMKTVSARTEKAFADFVKENEIPDSELYAYMPDFDAIENEGLEALRRSGALAYMFLTENDHTLPGVEHWNDGRINHYGTSRALVEHAETFEGYEAFIDEVGQEVISKEQIFDGFTPSGRRRYLKHDLQTVVRLLKRDLRGGENFNYGVGNIRALVSKQFKSISDIKASEDKLVTDEEFEPIKEAINERFFALAEEMKPLAKSKHGNEFGWLDIFSDHMQEMIERRSIPRVMEQYYENFTDEDVEKVAAFIQALRDMPTEYFEAKLQRAVGINEFSGAVVPEGPEYDEAIEALKRNGVERIERYKKHDKDSRTQAIGKFSNVFFQNDNRASVEIPVTGILSDQDVVVRLTQASDLSSFLHESGHIFLEIYKSLAPEHEAINEEYQKILAWLGATDGNITTEHHEKFAEGFETWLFEGKSPSEDMRFTFARFRAWLTRVYKDIANMRIQLNDEAREIFNNMFATEEAIKAAYASAQFDADPTLLELMTDAEKAGLEKARAKARTTSEESVLRETIRETERRRSKEYKEEAKKVKAEVADNVWSQPIYQAWHLLTKGKLYNEDTPAELENIKLSRGAIVEMRGEGFLPGLPRGFNHIYRKEGGVHPDQIATLFGFQSGDELLDKLANSPKPTDLIEAETQAEMVSRHGDIKTDGTIEREATEAVYNLDAERFLRIEQKMLARKAGKEATSLSVLKQTAKRLIESRPRKEVIKPGRYAINSQRAARQAVRAAAEGDFETALQQKERQILNHELSRLAYQAREDYTKKRAYLDKVVRKKYDRKSMAPEYIGQAKRLIGLYYGLSQTPEADALSLQAWKTETDNDPAKASGDIPIDVILFDPNNPDADKIPHIDDLSMEKLRDLYLSVRMIEKAGRKESELENDGYLQEATALAENVLANNKIRKKPKVFRDEPGEAETLRTGYVNAIERMSTIIDQLDGYVEGFGLFREKIWKGIRAGVNESERIHRLMHDQIVKAFEGMKPSELRRKVYVSEVNETFTIEEIMMMAQQTGSESNYQALLDDLTKNKDAQFSEDQIWAILDRLDKKHWDVVQNVWNVFEYWRPFVWKQAEKLDGVPPPRVEPVEVQTRHGTYAGGYFRLKYSQLPGEKGFDEMAKEQAARNSGGAFAREATNKGMLQQRKGSGGRRIVYNYTSLTKSLDETANMLAFREPMDRAARILNKRVLREAIIDTLGEQRLHTINNMFIRIGAGYIDPHGSIAPILRKLRIGAMMADLGFNLRTWATQWLGVFQSLELLTMGELAHGYADYVAKGYRFAFDRSEFMRSRPITRQRELLEQSRRRGLSGRLSKAQEISMVPLGTIDTFTVALPTWYAAYYKGVQKLGMTEKDAVLYADQIVSDTQSAGQITEMALLQTGNEIEKGFTYMWGYFSTTYNLTLRRARREALRVREAEGVAKAPALTVAGFNMTMTVMKLYAIPGVLAALMLEHWPGDDNDEDWPEWLAWALANQSLGVLPMLRDIPREVRYAFGGGGTLSSDRFFGSISDVIKGSIKTGKSYYVDDDLEVDPQLIKGLARAMAQYYGIPGTNQAIRIVDDVLLDDDPTFWEATMIGKDQDN